jgi:hypothetical protein
VPRTEPEGKAALPTIAESPDREAALAGVERWLHAHPDVAPYLSLEDFLVDSMRGRSTNWTRVRVNLRKVPKARRPKQGKPDPDDAPTR